MAAHTTRIEVVEIATGEVVSSFESKFDPESASHERMMLGLLTNMDTDCYFVRDTPNRAE